jgi:hypothetical protein
MYAHSYRSLLRFAEALLKNIQHKIRRTGQSPAAQGAGTFPKNYNLTDAELVYNLLSFRPSN